MLIMEFTIDLREDIEKERHINGNPYKVFRKGMREGVRLNSLLVATNAYSHSFTVHDSHRSV